MRGPLPFEEGRLLDGKGRLKMRQQFLQHFGRPIRFGSTWAIEMEHQRNAASAFLDKNERQKATLRTKAFTHGYFPLGTEPRL